MESNYFEEFVKNPFAQKYLRYCESTLCNTVTMISAVCEEINRMNKKKHLKETSELLGYINSLCFRFMRLSDCNASLLRMADGNEEEVIYLGTFLHFFADRCNEVIGEACPVHISGNADMKIKISKSLINRSMLEFIRNYGLKYGRGTEFSVRYGIESENIFIVLEITAFGEPDAFSEKYDINIFKDYCNEINKMFSEKSGMKYIYEDNSMKIIIPIDSANENLEFSDSPAVIDRGEFSEYNTMLSDLLE